MILAAALTLTVFAPASLTDVLPAIADLWFQKTGVKVALSLDATSRLAKQVEAGAPADVFISADKDWMDELEKDGSALKKTESTLAWNTLVIVVPSSSTLKIASPADLAVPELKHLALAGENVPAGKYAQAALTYLKAWDAVKDRIVRGDNVRTTLRWVASGEAEAGIVYRTDALAEPKVQAVFTFPEKTHQPIVYLGAVMSRSTQQAAARSFLSFCRSPKALALWLQAGFLTRRP